MNRTSRRIYRAMREANKSGRKHICFRALQFNPFEITSEAVNFCLEEETRDALFFYLSSTLKKDWDFQFFGIRITCTMDPKAPAYQLM